MTVCSLPLCPHSPPGSSALLIKTELTGLSPIPGGLFSHLHSLGMAEAGVNALLSGGSMEETSTLSYRLFLISKKKKKKSASLCLLIYPSQCFICNIF